MPVHCTDVIDFGK